jgi:hypothetical protein
MEGFSMNEINELEEAITSIELEILEHDYKQAEAEYDASLNNAPLSEEQREREYHFMLEAKDRLENAQNPPEYKQSYEAALHDIDQDELRLINEYDLYEMEMDWDSPLDIDLMHEIDSYQGNDGVER